MFLNVTYPISLVMFLNVIYPHLAPDVLGCYVSHLAPGVLECYSSHLTLVFCFRFVLVMVWRCTFRVGDRTRARGGGAIQVRAKKPRPAPHHSWLPERRAGAVGLREQEKPAADASG